MICHGRSRIRCFPVRVLYMVLLIIVTGVSAEEAWPPPVEDNQVFGFALLDQFEYSGNEGTDTFSWDSQGWWGTDYHKLWVKTEGDQQTADDKDGELEIQALYSRLIASFWDVQIGARYDRVYGNGPDDSRAFAVIGVQGLAPYRFEVEPSLFISDDGDISARFVATYDLLFTQRLITQLRFELNAAADEEEAFGIGDGLNDIELGLRLRYEFKRELAPYVGISWVRSLGNTADLARREGEEVSDLSIVAGVRFWF